MRAFAFSSVRFLRTRTPSAPPRAEHHHAQRRERHEPARAIERRAAGLHADGKDAEALRRTDAVERTRNLLRLRLGQCGGKADADHLRLAGRGQ